MGIFVFAIILSLAGQVQVCGDGPTVADQIKDGLLNQCQGRTAVYDVNK